MPGYYQKVSSNAHIEVEKTNVGMNYEQLQASQNLVSNQYYLRQENTPQHGGIQSQMRPNIQPGNPPFSYPYPYMPYANAAMVGLMSSQNLPQYPVQMNPGAQFEQQPGFSPNMIPFGMLPYFNSPASGIQGRYNMPFAGETTPQLPYPQSGHPTTGYPLSSMQHNQPGPTVDGDPDNAANADDEDGKS